MLCRIRNFLPREIYLCVCAISERRRRSVDCPQYSFLRLDEKRERRKKSIKLQRLFVERRRPASNSGQISYVREVKFSCARDTVLCTLRIKILDEATNIFDSSAATAESKCPSRNKIRHDKILSERGTRARLPYDVFIRTYFSSILRSRARAISFRRDAKFLPRPRARAGIATPCPVLHAAASAPNDYEIPTPRRRDSPRRALSALLDISRHVVEPLAVKRTRRERRHPPRAAAPRARAESRRKAHALSDRRGAHEGGRGGRE